MPGLKPNIVKVYRIVHIDNIAYILERGMFNRTHQNADPDYINIGDSDLIAKQHDYPVGVTPPGGALGEYVPFYFGRLSPMLLNIKTGYRGIKQRHQKDIVYIVCKLDDIVAQCTEWCFTEGHAKTRITTFYNHLNDLDEVHWDKVDLRFWHNSEDDFDRMRHKQAEFLVKAHVPVNCIAGIVAYDHEAASRIKTILLKLNLKIVVKVNPNGTYYY